MYNCLIANKNLQTIDKEKPFDVAPPSAEVVVNTASKLKTFPSSVLSNIGIIVAKLDPHIGLKL